MSGRINGMERLGDGHYVTTYVDVCRNCKGKGTVTLSSYYSTGSSRERVTECTVCEGTGRVVVSKEIHIKVEPYKTT